MKLPAAGALAELRGQSSLRWLGLLLAGLLFVRLVALALNSTDLFFDEAQYWSWSQEPAFGYYSKPPLIAWAIGAATAVCGGSEFCIRLPSPLFHTATALIIFAIGSRLYDARIGFWSALAFATLPGISLSAGIISTDAPLLTFWALALYAFVAMGESRRWWPALVLGLALGLGLNAKYAMAYFAVGLLTYAAWSETGRRRVGDPRLWTAVVVAILLIAPNLIWNASNSFATFSHTADNAKWSGQLINPVKALEFFGAQFGVFGPILFAGLLVIVWRRPLEGFAEPERLLLSFALPIIAIVTVQAFISRAHANWAAVAYVAASVVVVASMIRASDWRWLQASFAIHLAVLLLLTGSTTLASRIALPGGGNPFARTLGWEEVAQATAEQVRNARQKGQPYKAILGEERALVAELLYYLPAIAEENAQPPVLAWRRSGRPTDHFELTRPYAAASGEPVLLVSLVEWPEQITSGFRHVEKLGTRDVPTGGTSMRRLYFFRLGGFERRSE
ncbi:MAG: hypothetical protein RLZ98_3309 [Pseudomonadota bacterium]|jgi:4-amino-4-deoxy-L-arabinose transferase-like glycosyltransferase